MGPCCNYCSKGLKFSNSPEQWGFVVHEKDGYLASGKQYRVSSWPADDSRLPPPPADAPPLAGYPMTIFCGDHLGVRNDMYCTAATGRRE